MTMTEWATGVLVRRDMVVKTEMPRGVRSACVEDGHGAVILVDGAQPRSDQMVLTLREMIGLARRRCDRRGTSPTVPLLIVGLAGVVYNLATVTSATVRGLAVVLAELGVPSSVRALLAAAALGALAASGVQVCPFLPNLW